LEKYLDVTEEEGFAVCNVCKRKYFMNEETYVVKVFNRKTRKPEWRCRNHLKGLDPPHGREIAHKISKFVAIPKLKRKLKESRA